MIHALFWLLTVAVYAFQLWALLGISPEAAGAFLPITVVVYLGLSAILHHYDCKR